MEQTSNDYTPDRSARVFNDQAFAEKEQTAEINGDRMVRYDRTYRIRPPDGYALYREFFEALAPLTTGFPMRTAGIWRLPHQPERVLE
jgi:hypothetical protein